MLVDLVAARTRARLARRWVAAAEHLRLLAVHGFTPDMCPVCEDCPDWINHPPRRF